MTGSHGPIPSLRCAPFRAAMTYRKSAKKKALSIGERALTSTNRVFDKNYGSSTEAPSCTSANRAMMVKVIVGEMPRTEPSPRTKLHTSG